MKNNIFSTIYKAIRCAALPFFLIGSFNAMAQPVNNLVKDVTMPAPNAAALGKYGDYSVGNFTGVPDISIPIYTVQEGPLSLPVSVNYHASGNKVAEMASWVGAGWSLNAGGIISRTVQGIPDEGSNGYYNTATNLENSINTAGASAPLNAQLAGDIANAIKDGEPDIFSFNVTGYTGKFYIDKNQTVQFIPKQDLKIVIDGDYGIFFGFTLITPDGTRYIFGRASNPNGSFNNTVVETTLMQEQTGQQYPTSWYLVRIESPDRKYQINLS